MRAVITLLTLLAAVSAEAADWPAVVKGLEHKIVRLEVLQAGSDAPWVCSGVIINAQAGFVVTAGHCLASDGDRWPDVTARGADAAVVRVNRLLDIGVIRMEPRTGDLAVALAEHTPAVGTEVAVVGHAFAYRTQVVTFGHLAMVLDDDGRQMRVDAMSIPGMSGGALLDAEGRLVGLVSSILSIGPAHLSSMVTAEQLRDYLMQYLPRP